MTKNELAFGNEDTFSGAVRREESTPDSSRVAVPARRRARLEGVLQGSTDHMNWEKISRGTSHAPCVASLESVATTFAWMRGNSGLEQPRHVVARLFLIEEDEARFPSHERKDASDER